MDEITLNAQLRSESGKGTAHKLRAKGMIPGVFYLGKK
ncbi:MAG TPA: 50S ribosomal protein L25, partial [Bacteroidetes bacterium]|nr:50S ribosomal protein L25 [Bacteroidota bacterium]